MVYRPISALNKKYPTQIIGMPNWDAINFKAETLKEYGIVYTTPFYMSKWQGYSKTLAASYKAKYKGNPSDMVYKAYDITSYFLSVMLSYPGDIMKHINDGKVKIFTDPFYKPNFTSTGATTPDYYENKRIIFLRKQNGTITKAW